MEAISGMSGEEFIFHKVHGNVYVRKCYGTEAIASLAQEIRKGLTMLTVTAAISLDSSPSRELLQTQVCEAWQLLRHLVPGIACQTLKLPPFDGQYELRYTVPQSLEDVDAWADQSTFLMTALYRFMRSTNSLRTIDGGILPSLITIRNYTSLRWRHLQAGNSVLLWRTIASMGVVHLRFLSSFLSF
ncbi:hypothetical protein DFH11DRAFT_1131013 [Phellopilus nigrolimitatus]|nr:hypothetical protein DFH11DRAFT_1131013 [Phellopilus nigrolimitatus]